MTFGSPFRHRQSRRDIRPGDPPVMAPRHFPNCAIHPRLDRLGVVIPGGGFPVQSKAWSCETSFGGCTFHLEQNLKVGHSNRKASSARPTRDRAGTRRSPRPAKQRSETRPMRRCTPMADGSHPIDFLGVGWGLYLLGISLSSRAKQLLCDRPGRITSLCPGRVPGARCKSSA